MDGGETGSWATGTPVHDTDHFYWRVDTGNARGLIMLSLSLSRSLSGHFSSSVNYMLPNLY